MDRIEGFSILVRQLELRWLCVKKVMLKNSDLFTLAQ
jgi:hypothetical protein